MTALPQPSTPFLGRTDELEAIAHLLADPACRLLTLVGPGGIGKTRLAIQAALEQQPRFPDGVYFVSLASVSSPDRIISALTSVLGITVFGSENPLSRIVYFLREKQVLLVIDNFEHLLEAVGLLTDLLQACPSLKLLVTSRETLNVQEEWVLALGGLSFPAEPITDTLADYSAVQLFVERARRMQAHFSLDDNATAVQAICQQVEGMPLGLELAASWLRALSCQQIVVQMKANLDFLTTPLRNIPDRHRSLRAVFDQSWRLLTADEQTVLMKLSVFRGGFDLEAAQQVAGASLQVLASLVDKSLVRLAVNGRYDLHELLRQFAADKLAESGQADAAAQSHLDYFLTLAEQADAHAFGHGQVEWFDRVETELDNLRTALAYSLQPAAAERGLRLTTALGWFYTERVFCLEGRDWFNRLLPVNPHAPASLRAKALHRAGAIVGMMESPEQMRIYCEEALALSRQIHDRWNEAWTLCHLGVYSDIEIDQKAAILEESLALFRQLDDQMGITHTAGRRVWMALAQQDFPYARQLSQEISKRAHDAGDKAMEAWASYDLGRLTWFQDHDLVRAHAQLETSLRLFKEAHLRVALSHGYLPLADMEHALGNLEKSKALYKDALLVMKGGRDSWGDFFFLIRGLANVARSQGDFKRAVRLLAATTRENIFFDKLSWYELEDRFDALVAELRAELGEPAFTQAWEAGRAMTQPQVIAYALEDDHPPPQPTNGAHPPLLTPRELEILGLVADGLSNREVADRLSYTVGTVKWYLNEIYTKLGVHGRAKAVLHARQQGLLS